MVPSTVQPLFNLLSRIYYFLQKNQYDGVAVCCSTHSPYKLAVCLSVLQTAWHVRALARLFFFFGKSTGKTL